ncbi:hypothetical protein AAH343_000371 [Escherichia coli]
MGPFEKRNGVTVETGDILYRDGSINSGTKGLISCHNTWSGAGENLSAGAQIKNMCYVDDHATANSDLMAAGNGYQLNAVHAQGINLPASMIATAGMTDYLYTFWLKVTGAAAATSNSFLVALTNGIPSNAANTLFWLRPTFSSPTSASALQVLNHGEVINAYSFLSGLFDGNVHQVGVERVVSPDGTMQKSRLYLDGVLKYESSFSAIVAYPAAITLARVGDAEITTTSLSVNGGVYRCRLDDLTLTTKTALEVLADDINLVNGRYS